MTKARLASIDIRLTETLSSKHFKCLRAARSSVIPKIATDGTLLMSQGKKTMVQNTIAYKECIPCLLLMHL